MQTVIATFDDRQTAQQTVERLIEQGFSRSAVHLQSGYDASTASSSATSADEGGFFAGIGHFFNDLFGADSTSDAGTYAEAVRRGSTVVVVDAASEAEVDKARMLLQDVATVDVDQRAAEWKSQGWTGFDASAKPMAADVAGQTVMPVVQESLEVGKRSVAGGAVRVVQRVIETPVSELVKLRQERAVVERRPVDRPATEADFANFKEGTIEVQEMAEQAVVGKTARVVEEVVVGKEVTERTETVSDTVRRTDVAVERVAGDTTTTDSTKAGTAGAMGANASQARGTAKQVEGAAKDAAGSASGSLTEKVEGKVEKMAGKVQEGYGNLKDDLTGRGAP